MNIKETKKRIIQAGHKAVEELIKVAKEAIVDSDDDISADRLKNAAATKKLAIFDAFEILNRIKEEENILEGREPEEKNSRSYFDEDTYLVSFDQIFLYKRDNKWKAPKGYCFVQPIKTTDEFNMDSEKPLTGIVKYSDGTVDVGDLVGFRPNSEYEFIIDDTRLYRVLSNFITIKYEYQGNEETYNPSWAQSS